MTLAQINGSLQNFLNGFLKSVPAITNLFMTNWTNDPNVLGGYSYTRVGTKNTTFSALGNVFRHGNNSLWFIGEATHPDDYSYTHGAYESGVNAATAALKPYP